ncbi:hypothetical protein RvY_02933 [Ramazzottius varieornatus]|uniref:ZP domain-containing protein n=1 Tax=Ramazzottius varieornatus TaxID=947166 RepID=A0A1D1UTF3_RAMVA|nr:hypothetical protein RvY_02933 [Ramazzottius varieornatus]
MANFKSAVLSIAICLLLRVEARTEVEMRDTNHTTPVIEGRQFGGPVGTPFISYGLGSGNGIPIQQSGNHLNPWTAVTFPPTLDQPRPMAPQAETPVPVRQDSIVPTKNHYKLAVSCGNDFMTVKMDFERPFYGIVYSKGFFNKPQCIYVRGDKSSASFNFTINYNTCGSYNRKAQAPLFPSYITTSSTTTMPSTTASTLRWTDSTTPFSIVRQLVPSPIPLQPSSAQGSYDPNLYYGPQAATSPPVEPQQQPQSSSFNQQPVAQQQQQLQPTSAFQAPQPHQLFSPVQQQQQFQPVQQQFQPLQQQLQPLYNIPHYQLPTGLLNYAAPLQQNAYGLNGLGLAFPVQQTHMYPLNPYGSAGSLGGFLPTSYGGPMARPMARSMDDDEAAPTIDMQWVENTIIIQQDENVQDALDDAKSLQCEWKERYNQKIVTEGYKVELADVVRASFPGDNVGAYMQIKTGLSPLSPDTKDVVKIGSPLTLVVGLTNSTGNFDLLVHSCTATGSGASPSIQLVDEKGCVTRDKYFGPFMPFRSVSSPFGKNRVVYAFFQAFKFPDSTEVNLECSVTICRNSCPAQCAGRYNKGGEDLLNNPSVKVTASPLQTFQKRPLTRPFNVNSTLSQGRIIEALERRLSSVNGPQEISVDKAPSNPRFLMLRELDDASAVSNLTSSTVKPPSLLKMKREAELESSKVDLRRRMTVINTSDVEDLNSDLLLGSAPSDVDALPERSLLPLPPSLPSNTTNGTVIGKSEPEPLQQAAAVEKVTEAPAFYAVQDGYQHVCLPLLVVIGVGVGVALLVLLSLICGLSMCCRYRALVKKQKRSFNLYSTTSLYSEPKSIGASPTRARNFTEL